VHRVSIAVAAGFAILALVFAAAALRDYRPRGRTHTPAGHTWLRVAWIFAAVSILLAALSVAAGRYHRKQACPQPARRSLGAEPPNSMSAPDQARAEPPRRGLTLRRDSRGGRQKPSESLSVKPYSLAGAPGRRLRL
jgi:hypothetical protein